MVDIRRFTFRSVIALFVCVLALSVCYPQSQGAIQDEPEFRSPVVLKLHVDKEHYFNDGIVHISLALYPVAHH